ncbi:hypothetical protein B0I00_2658 [Novosphingobium kunmingense]|uniref:Uncharacterized protein n=1 Tax=Novosphingobium kunmingense TaxID=1211806 RepID=A0A2N0H510_9SPHN|nr:hypothetical protein [Novosphingobium kunmingense]PKB14030.1 hypothetical protein B0I00_2658 [Novosphingobium kunmingense]
MPRISPIALTAFACLAGALALAAPVAAHDQITHPGSPGYDRAAWDQARADWLAECRANRGGDGRYGKIGEAAVGGVRTAGADRQTERRRLDWCESYLERHMAPGYGYGASPIYGYQPMLVMVPVAMTQAPAAVPAPAAPRECTETQVIEEDVPVGPARRVLPPRPRPAPVKRVPDKRVPIG